MVFRVWLSYYFWELVTSDGLDVVGHIDSFLLAWRHKATSLDAEDWREFRLQLADGFFIFDQEGDWSLTFVISGDKDGLSNGCVSNIFKYFDCFEECFITEGGDRHFLLDDVDGYFSVRLFQPLFKTFFDLIGAIDASHTWNLDRIDFSFVFLKFSWHLKFIMMSRKR